MKNIALIIFSVIIGLHVSGQTLITEYEYWFDNNYLSKVHISISPTDTCNLKTAINCGQVNVGLHAFNIRFKDNLGQWSSTYSQYFQKMELPKTDNVLVYGEYWINDNRNDLQTIVIDSNATFVLLDNLNISSATKATNTVHYRFRDKYGYWSSVYSLNFYHPVEADFTHIAGGLEVAFTNTSKFADTYHWDFGDSTTSNQVNPLHTYSEPGAYKVQLIASNYQYTDSIYHYVEIEGIKKITNRKGGNSGFVSTDIYGGLVDTSIVVTLVKNGTTISTHSIYKKEPGVICVTFDLTGKETGFYDIIIVVNGKTYTFIDGFEIEEGGWVAPYAELEGNNIFIPGRWQTYTVNYGNLGNADIYGLPINIIFNEQSEVEFIFDLVDSIGGGNTDANNSENYVALTSLYGEPYNGKMYSILIPHIPANTSGSFSFRLNLKTGSFTRMYVTAGDVLNDEYFNPQEDEIEVEDIFGYELTGKFKVEKEKLSQAIRNEINKSFQNPQTTERKQFVNFAKFMETSDNFTKLSKQSGGTVNNPMCPRVKVEDNCKNMIELIEKESVGKIYIKNNSVITTFTVRVWPKLYNGKESTPSIPYTVKPQEEKFVFFTHSGGKRVVELSDIVIFECCTEK
jgi:PKD repeat protein